MKQYHIDFGFNPSWISRCSCGADIEKELAPDFVFKGSGWYFTKTDTLLIMEENLVLGQAYKDVNDGPYFICCWNTGELSNQDIMKSILNRVGLIFTAPIRLDTR